MKCAYCESEHSTNLICHQMIVQHAQMFVKPGRCPDCDALIAQREMLVEMLGKWIKLISPGCAVSYRAVEKLLEESRQTLAAVQQGKE